MRTLLTLKQFLPHSRRARWALAGSLLLANALVGLAVLKMSASHEATVVNRIKAGESVRAHAYAFEFERAFQVYVDTTQLFAAQHELEEFLINRDPVLLRKIQADAQELLMVHRDIGQVRLLDAGGMEVLRVNQGGRIVPGPELQDKSEYDYFTASRSLAPDSIYISSIDLNKERDEIERPFKPVVRFAQPLFVDDAFAGILVLNVRLAAVIEVFDRMAHEFAHRMRILTPDGYWLRAQSPTQEWGFMLSDRRNMTLAHSEPDLWRVMHTNPRGQLIANDRLFSWEQVRLTHDRIGVSLVSANDHYFFASEITAEDWADLLQQEQFNYVMIGGVISLLISVIVIGAFGRHEIHKRERQALQDAAEAAQESARIKSQFLANMSHEIRTPMNGVIGMTDLILDSNLTAQQRSFAETIRSSGDTLLTLLNDILDFSKIEAGMLAIESVPFDPRDPIESALAILSDKAHQKGVELACLVESDVPPHVRGDPNRLQQILTNLVSNAVKFTARGEVVIKVTATRRDDDHCMLHVSVRDTGIGIDEETRQRLFQPFVQADASTTRRFGGTGLGLAICVELVERMGGEIDVKSTPGEGSVFTFTVELGILAGERNRPARSEAFSGSRVLVVDDNKTNREIFKRQLTNWGCEVVETAGGHAALLAMREATTAHREFNVVLLDMLMPELSGEDVATLIRENPEWNQTKIIIASSASMIISPERMVSMDIEALLQKPVRQSQLHDAVSRALSETAASPILETVMTQRAPTDRFLTGIKVLVAEDNVVNQSVITMHLSKLGAEFALAHHGGEAVEIARAEPFRLILMDCQMPVMDGFEAVRQIRAHEESAGTPRAVIVAVTADAMEEDRERCLSVGMDDYLAKPIRASELAQVLLRVLKAHPEQRS